MTTTGINTMEIHSYNINLWNFMTINVNDNQPTKIAQTF